MNISAISFENLEYPTPPVTDFLLGNVGDLVRVTVSFNSNQVFDAANYYMGIRPNNALLYPTGGTTIPIVNFQNPQTNAVQKYLIDGVGSGTYSVPIDRSHNTTQSIQMNNVAGNNYELIHTFRIPYYLAEEDNPTWSTQGNSLKYFFRLELRPSVIDSNIVDDSNSIDLTPLIKNGNVGAWEERFSGNSPHYTYSFFDDLEGINTLDNYQGSFVIQNSHPTNVFDATTRVKLYFAKRPSTYDETLSLNDNTEFEVVEFNAGGGNSGVSLIDITSTIDSTSQITVNYTINTASLDGDYSIWASVSTDDGTTPDMNNLKVVTFTVDAQYQGTDPVLKFGKFKFMQWWLQDETQATDCYNGFKGDDGRILFKISNVDTAVVTVNQFTVGIRQINGGVVESFNIAVSALPVEISRNRQRADSNYKNQIIVSKVGDDYSFSYGFEVWDEMVNGDYEIFVRASYDNNGTSGADEWSAAFGTAQQGTNQNLATQPIMELSSVEFYEVDGTGTPISGALANPSVGKDNLVKAYWTETNLGDMQTDAANLIGYIGVAPESQKAIKETWRYISSEYDSETDTPWKEPQGHPANRAKVTKIDLTNASVEAILTWSGYNSLFDYQDPCFLARLDRKCAVPNLGNIKLSMMHFRTFDYSEVPPTSGITGAACGTDLTYKGSGSEPRTLGEWEIPNGEAIHFYVNPFSVPDWFFIEQITNFGDAIGTGTKIASTGRDAGGNYNDPAVGIFDASTFPSNNGFIGSWRTFTLPIPDRTTEMFNDTGFDASSYMVNAYDQVLWYKNMTGSAIKIALRIVPNKNSSTIFEAKRICP